LSAQKSNEGLFKIAEDSCILYSNQINPNQSDSENLNINNKLSSTLKNFLNTPGSFDYSLDSLKLVGKIYAPDRSFRIISWNIRLNNGEFKYFGFIQVYDSQSKSVNIFELIDRTGEIINPENSVLSAGKWLGAIYYKILKEKVDNRTYYTMMGVQYHNVVITRKVVEILFFNEYGNPVFGAPIIQVNNKKKHRLVFDYSALASVHLNYDEKLKMIVFDHVAAAEPKYNGQFEYYGPDLTFDGLVFKKGLWNYTPNLDLRQPFSTAPKHKPLH
jgi:hypothetical protein